MEEIKKYLLILSVIFVCGCNEINDMRQKAANKTCAEEQFKKVKEFYDLCIEAGFKKSYCLSWAMFQNCDDLEATK